MVSILFVNVCQDRIYSYRHTDYQFPLGLGYLVGSVLKKGFMVYVIDAERERLSIEGTVERIFSYKVDYVAFSCTTPMYFTVFKITKLLKEQSYSAKIVVGGPHITALYDRIKYENCFDYLFVGEGEISLPDFLTNKKSSKVIFGGQYTDNIDRYVMPARHLFYSEAFIDTRLKSPFTYMITSRGCIGRCKYCVAGNSRRPVRFRSVQNIREELLDIKNLGIKGICFEDDNLLINKKYVLSLCEELKRHEIPYYGMAIPKFVDQDVLRALKNSGCLWLHYGVESGDDSILKDMGRLSNTQEVYDAVRMTQDIGIKVRASYMLGWINETEEQIETTLRFIEKLDADENAIAIVTPYPGTKLWDSVKHIDHGNFERFCYYNKIGYNLSAVSDEKLLEFQQMAFSIG